MRKNYAPIKYTLRLSAAHYAHEYLFTFAHFVSLCYILGLARLIIRKKSIRMNFNLIICDGLRVFFAIHPFLFHCDTLAWACACTRSHIRARVFNFTQNHSDERGRMDNTTKQSKAKQNDGDDVFFSASIYSIQ